MDPDHRNPADNQTPEQVVADFRRWLDQNDPHGTDWFWDEGEPESLPVAEPVVEPVAEPVVEPAVESAVEPMVEPMAATEQPAETTAPEAAAPAIPAGGNDDDPFQAECDGFISRTLEAMTSQGVALGAGAAEDAAADSDAALAELQAEVSSCTACALHESRTRTVFGGGSPRSGILFIGEAPGRDEDLQGEPFVGRSGQLLTKIIGAIGFQRDQVYICNILKCRPPNNRDPLPEEVACCEPYLKRQLAIIRPRVICCLGRIAAQTLLKTEASLRSLRETAHFYEGIPVMATYHPAALLRHPAWKRDTWNDVRKLRALHDALLEKGGAAGPGSGA